MRRLIEVIQRTSTIPNCNHDLLSSLNTIIIAHIKLSQGGSSRESSNNPQKVESLFEFLLGYDGRIRDPRNQVIFMVTAMMLEIIAGILTFKFIDSEGSETGPRAFPGIPGHFHADNGLIWRQMRHSGWCPSELSRLFSQFNTSCLYLIQNLSRPKPCESHNAIRIRQSQNVITPPTSTPLCTKFSCTHRQLQEDHYKTQHVIGCDGCDNIVADPSQLERILMQGKIPLILSIDDQNHHKDIHFVEYEPGSELAYVAISHVWSDGLGNVKQNALPRCQLLRLSRMSQSLPDKDSGILLFWCDTICVPPDTAGMSEAQALAMGQMRNVYAQANAVLVLDSWLYDSTAEDKPCIDVLLRIFCCTWNTRLWTYQEGALARTLYFQFKDGPFDLDASVKSLEICKDPLLRVTVVQQLLARYYILRGFKKQQTVPSKIGAIAFALANRSTSVPSDEALCLAVLLGLDTAEIARVEPTMRMAAMWRMLPTVGRTLAFRRTNTLDIPGLRWAPATFLKSPLSVGAENRNAEADSEEVRRDDLGMYIKSQGLIFVSRGRPFGPFSVQDQTGCWWHVYGYEAEVTTTCPADEIAVIIEEGAVDETSNLPEGSREVTFLKIASVARIVRKAGAIIYCQPLRTCMVHMMGSKSPLSHVLGAPLRLQPSVDCYDSSTENMIATAGRATVVDQVWCIG